MERIERFTKLKVALRGTKQSAKQSLLNESNIANAFHIFALIRYIIIRHTIIKISNIDFRSLGDFGSLKKEIIKIDLVDHCPITTLTNRSLFSLFWLLCASPCDNFRFFNFCFLFNGFFNSYNSRRTDSHNNRLRVIQNFDSFWINI